MKSHTSLALGPTNLSTLWRISLAALLVKVMAKILYGGTCSSNKCAMRQVNTFVLPEPAPAKINVGPAICFTASVCSLFNESKILVIASSFLFSLSQDNFSRLLLFLL